MKEARIRTLEMIVNLTVAKLQILKLKSDDYQWFGMMNEENRTQLTNTLSEIDNLLTTLNKELNGTGN